MADHDQHAELIGYQNELASLRGNDERAASIRKEIGRVSAAIGEQADNADRQAAAHDEAGQDVPAAEARVRARKLREGLPERAVAGGGDTETAESRDASPRTAKRGRS